MSPPDPEAPARPAHEKPRPGPPPLSANAKSNNPTGIEVDAKVEHKDSKLTGIVIDGPRFSSGTYIFEVVLGGSWEVKEWPLEKINLLEAAPPPPPKKRDLDEPPPDEHVVREDRPKPVHPLDRRKDRA